MYSFFVFYLYYFFFLFFFFQAEDGIRDVAVTGVQTCALPILLADRNLTLVLEPSARELLMREGYDPSYGARPLKRAIQSHIQNPLAVKLLQGEILPGQTIRVSAKGDALEFKTEQAFATA